MTFIIRSNPQGIKPSGSTKKAIENYGFAISYILYSFN